MLPFLIVTLTSCTAKDVGQAGVGLDSQGRVVAYLVVCKKNVDTLVLYYDDARTGEQVVGKWHSTTPVTRQSVVTLQNPPASWEERTRIKSLVGGIQYHLGGGSGDNKVSTEDVSFDLAALAKLSPGQILFQRGESARQVGDIGSMRSQVCT